MTSSVMVGKFKIKVEVHHNAIDDVIDDIIDGRKIQKLTKNLSIFG